jgi:hypothetical protein
VTVPKVDCVPPLGMSLSCPCIAQRRFRRLRHDGWAGKRLPTEAETLLVLDDIWEKNVEALMPKSSGLVAMHVAAARASVDFAGSFDGS